MKASELLYISQPALSKAIKTLEAEMQQKLIIPSGRGIAITDYGKALALEAEPLLEKLESLRSLHETQSLEKPFSIASFEVFSTYFLGSLITSDFTEKRVRILELTPGPMEAAITQGIADVGITYIPIPNPELDILKITSIEMGIYGLSKYQGVAFENLPFVIPTTVVPGSPSKVKGLDGWPDHLIQRKIRFEVTMMETALDLCRRGVAVGYFPQFVVDLHNQSAKTAMQLVCLPNPARLKKTSQDVYMLKRKSDIESNAFKKVSKALRKLSN